MSKIGIIESRLRSAKRPSVVIRTSTLLKLVVALRESQSRMMQAELREISKKGKK